MDGEQNVSQAAQNFNFTGLQECKTSYEDKAKHYLSCVLFMQDRRCHTNKEMRLNDDND